MSKACRVSSAYSMMPPTAAMISGIHDGSDANDLMDRSLARNPPRQIDLAVIGNQPRRPADLLHDGVAGIDAQPALDAFELRAVADIDAGRADIHALPAIDAIAGGKTFEPKLFALLDGGARLAAVVAIGDIQRVFVGQRGLDARPRAHIGADLLAHVAGERIGRGGQNADPDIGDERRVAGREVLHQRRSVGEIQNPGAAGPPGDHQPEKVLDALARDALAPSTAPHRAASVRGDRPRRSARSRETDRSTRSADTDSRTRPGRRRRS